jgi:phthiocerol/phenolphthiocerol synthesis type-I polyketide synthase E
MSDIQRQFPSHAIAIVGMSGRFPGAPDLDGFWANVQRGVESLEEFSDSDIEAAGIPLAQRVSPHFVRRGTVLENSEYFDAAFFGFSPREAQILDPQHRIFLECAWEALENAGYAPGAIDVPVGVYGGASMNTYLLSQILRDPALAASAGGYQLMLGNDKDFLCTRVSYKLDLRGPSVTVQTACSTSLVAVQVACRALQHHECDMALAGGVSVSFPQRAGYLYQEGMILSPDGHCRPFDSEARGTRPGAGCGIVVLKRLSDALADHDTIHAVIRGAAINNDGGAKAGFTAPSIEGQVEVIATAQALAGVEARSIGYLEAHGTATPLGDPIEIAALTQVFREVNDSTGYCRLGSLKANLGHLDAAAGIAGLIKAVLVLREREFPPLVNFKSASPQLRLEEGPFTASAAGGVWAEAATPRRAGVSSFGIGGTNAHVVLEEAPPSTPAERVSQPRLLLLSARSEAALDSACERLAVHLEARRSLDLGDVAWTLQVGRRSFPHRRMLVADDAATAIRALRAPGRPPAESAVHEGGERRVAFLFTGQGSQFPGMGRELYAREVVYRDAIDRCSEILKGALGLDLREVLFASPDDGRIHQTALAQPALFATEYALAMYWKSCGVEPVAMLGHSIGEYVAAHLAGVMSLGDALALVAERGRLMQGMPTGSMAAVHLGAAELTQRLSDWGGRVEVAAVNAVGLCTIAGPREAVADAIAALQSQGIDTRPLHTSHAFHSAMMEPMLAEFAARVAQVPLAAPSTPYVSNLTGTWITLQQSTSPAYYADHLRHAVQFAAGVRTLAADASLHLLEIGPGQSLTTLARLTLGRDGFRRVSASMNARRDAEPRMGEEQYAIAEAAGRLWLAGVSLRWSGLRGERPMRRVPLPTYAFERKRYSVDPVTPMPGTGTPTAVREVRVEGATTTTPARPKMSDFLFSPTWIRDDRLDDNAASLSGNWLVAGEADALRDAVVQLVRRAGGVPFTVEEGTGFERLGARALRIRPGSVDDVAALARVQRAAGEPIAGVILLWSLVDDHEPFDRQLLLRFHAQATFACGLDVSHSAPLRMVAVTAGTHSVLEEFVEQPGGAVTFGPVLALPAEVPGLESRLLDLPSRLDGLNTELTASWIVAEAAAGDTENLVVRRAGRRWLRRFEPAPISETAAGAPPLRAQAVVLITGGLGGMGLALARRLAERHQARLVLTSRGSFPPREQWDECLRDRAASAQYGATIEALRAIEAAGGEVLTAQADVADERAMRAAVSTARARWGRIHAVIHAAGIAGSGQLSALKSEADVRATLAPKVRGLQVLLELFGNDSLELVVLMSSVNAVLGAAGVADYAAANVALDAFVESSRVPPGWRHLVAIDWGAWREVGMAAKLEVPAARQSAWRAYLQHGLSTEEALELFERVIASRRRRAVVVPYDLNAAIAQLRTQQSGVLGRAALTPTAVSPEPSVGGNSAEGVGSMPSSRAADINEDPPIGDVEVRLAAIWVELLGVERVGASDNFFALGGHSLLATRVLARIDEGLGARLALRDVFDAPTLRELAKRIVATGASDETREELEF